MARQRITYEPELKGHPIQTNKKLNHGCIENIAEGYLMRLEYMTNKHSAVSVMQLVVSPPVSMQPDQTSRAVGTCLNTFKKTMANNGCEIQAGWVREVAESAEPDQNHYHIGIIANGSRCQSAVSIAKAFKKHMKKYSTNKDDLGSVHYCVPDHKRYNQQELLPIEKATAIKIKRDKPNADKQFDNAFHKVTYDAKNGIQKDRLLPGRGYGFTQLKE